GLELDAQQRRGPAMTLGECERLRDAVAKRADQPGRGHERSIDAGFLPARRVGDVGHPAPSPRRRRRLRDQGHDPIASVRLRGVQRGVRAAQQHRRVRILRRQLRHAATDREPETARETLGRAAAHGLTYAIEERGGFVQVARDEHHAVLLAAIAANEVLVGHVEPNRLRDERDDAVTGPVAELVVDLLEEVDVDHRAAQRRLLRDRVLEDASERLEERAPVHAAGQRIARGEIAQLGVVLLDGLARLFELRERPLKLRVLLTHLRDVVEARQGSAQTAVWIQYRRRVHRERADRVVRGAQLEHAIGDGGPGGHRLDPGQRGNAAARLRGAPIELGRSLADELVGWYLEVATEGAVRE